MGQEFSIGTAGPSAVSAAGTPYPTAMARLLAVAGHDLKQPLHVAMMSIELALSEKRPARASERLGIAQEALRRLGLELDDLARCSQSASALLPRREAIRLDAVFDAIQRDWRFYAERCGVELRLQRSACFVESDPAMLMTILRNLVGNAVKYSKRGGRVVVGCRRRDGHLSIEVHDRGHGIPSGRLACIFDAFERGAWSGIGSGLGLGLFIVRQTADALGHGVRVRSAEGVGSTFAVLVPRVDCADRAASRPTCTSRPRSVDAPLPRERPAMARGRARLNKPAARGSTGSRRLGVAATAAAALVAAAALGPAFAQARPATTSVTCSAATALVSQRGAIVLSTGPTTYDRFVSGAAACDNSQTTEPAFERTTDIPQCFIGYRCRGRTGGGGNGGS